MSDVILKVENLSKQYRLGLIGTGTVRDDLKRWWYNIRGKEDPFLKIGDVNDRSESAQSDYVWALKDINFEVKKGEVLGIIGKNGAGKSTLLKILSKITGPTTGNVKSKGTVASLLEVGTGFHGELTGRENIYLNGAILGMTKKEITSKIDEIIEFSGCERYIDTPVKRYSSGMTVRLAFAVAAFLEPDILIIDEVLAVGDAEFQKKAIGKMQDIAKGGGRTVLFVSHNMDSVLRICKKAILLKNGSILKKGAASEIVDYYLNSEFGVSSKKVWGDNGKFGFVQIISVEAHDKNYVNKDNFYLNEEVGITMKYTVSNAKCKVQTAYNFHNTSGVNIFDSHENNTELYHELKDGTYKTTVWVSKNLFSEGVIIIGVALVTHDPFKIHFHEQEVIAFNMIDKMEKDSFRGDYVGKLPGIIRPQFKWKSQEVKQELKF